jgi:hypothetical protein
MYTCLTIVVSPFRLSTLPTYYIPKDGPLQTYKEYINQLPNVDHPEAFGQHSNADIASQIKETRSVGWSVDVELWWELFYSCSGHTGIYYLLMSTN